MKKSSAVAVLVVAVAVAAGLFLPAAASAQFVDPYYTYFGVNKIAYDTFTWKTYRSTHFLIYFHDRGADLPAEGRVLRRERLRRHLAVPELPDSEADQHHLLRDPHRIRADEHARRLHSRRRGRLRPADAQPDGPADRHARRGAPEAHRPRAHARLPVRDFLRRQLHPGVHLGRAAVADGRHGLLLRLRRGLEGHDGPPRRRPRRPGPRDRRAGHLRLLRVPLRPRRLRLHRGRVGQGRRAGLRLRVPRTARAEHRPRPPAHVRRQRRGLRHPLPPLPAPAFPEDADRARRADRLRRPGPPLAGGLGRGLGSPLPLRRLRRRDLDARTGRERRGLLAPGPQALPEPDQGLQDRLRVHRRPVADDRPGRRGRPRRLPRRQLARVLRQEASAAASSCSSTPWTGRSRR